MNPLIDPHLASPLVEVWHVPLSLCSRRAIALYRSLDVHERAAADRAGSEQHWRQRVLSRYALHQILTSCVFPVGCSLGASSRKIEGANQTTHEAPNEHP